MTVWSVSSTSHGFALIDAVGDVREGTPEDQIKTALGEYDYGMYLLIWEDPARDPRVDVIGPAPTTARYAPISKQALDVLEAAKLEAKK